MIRGAHRQRSLPLNQVDHWEKAALGRVLHQIPVEAGTSQAQPWHRLISRCPRDYPQGSRRLIPFAGAFEVRDIEVPAMDAIDPVPNAAPIIWRRRNPLW